MSDAKPRVLRLDPVTPEPDVIAEGARVLRGGGLVAFPTETVYGLGARGLVPDEVSRIFAAKRRPVGHPLILHVDGEPMARSLARTFTAAASRFAAAFWPGPLTLVVPRGESVPTEVTGGLHTVALRAPRHPVALALIRAVGEPLAAPSANAHTHVSPTTAAHVVRSLGDRVDLVLDAGPSAHGIESTVLAMTDPPRVLRPGAVSLERLRAVDAAVQYEVSVIEGDGARAAPGMAAKHYAPSARVVLAARGAEVDRAIAAELASARRGAHPEPRVAAIVATEAGRRAAHGASPLLVLPDEAEAYARELFAALHSVDEAGAEVVVIEQVPPDDPRWWAVEDRLVRAARRS